MERIAHKSNNFEAADAWDRRQLAALSVDERQQIARELRRRAYGADNPDVRVATRRMQVVGRDA